MESSGGGSAEKRQQATKVLVRFGVVAVLILAGVVACTTSLSRGDSVTSQCRDLVGDRYGGDNRFIKVTFTDDDRVKGTVGQYSGGQESLYGHWECTVEEGAPEITFFSRAG
jgi:hypothetical protein